MDIKGIKNNPYGMITNQSDSIIKSSKISREKTEVTSGGELYLQEDKVNLSSEGKLYIEGYKEAMQSTDIRQEKIDLIKTAIASGNYNIDSKDIAQKMLGSEFEIFG